MQNKETREKIAVKSTINVLQSIRDIPHGTTVWVSPEELGRPRESIYATINRVGTERPGEYSFHWSDEERAFCVTRN